MAKRTLENCGVIRRNIRRGLGSPDQYDGKCMGYGRRCHDDEPIEACKRCKLNTTYEGADDE